jgi:hypothetical protein
MAKGDYREANEWKQGSDANAPESAIGGLV